MPSMSDIAAAEAVESIGYRAEEIRTGEPTGSAKLKWVVIVDRTLSAGQAVNSGGRPWPSAWRVRGGGGGGGSDHGALWLPRGDKLSPR